jgi:hypothetical protein
MGDVTKPIIHFTADRPLALDVEAMIRMGRPWLAYPKPDDLVPSDERFSDNPGPTALLEKLDHAALPTVPDLREGFPWLDVRHRLHLVDPRSGLDGNIVAMQIGLRWQSLIVLPTRAPWMTEPAIPADPKFKWWTALRDVPSSYVSSRDESERFLYYDGPTRARPPVIATFPGRAIHFAPGTALELNPEAIGRTSQDPNPPLRQDRTPARNAREAFYIRVTNGRPAAYRFVLPDTTEAFKQAVPDTLPIDADHAEARRPRRGRPSIDANRVRPDAPGGRRTRHRLAPPPLPNQRLPPAPPPLRRRLRRPLSAERPPAADDAGPPRLGPDRILTR